MQWLKANNFPALTATHATNHIHIWRASLTQDVEERNKLYQLLNIEEQIRANKFIAEKPANNFIVARATLRQLLGKYLNIAPQNLTFTQNNYGKLSLPLSSLNFNLSHSHNMALFVFALNTPVGIDIEFIKESFEFTEIAKKYFSKEEALHLFSLPKNHRQIAFFNIWTRKEAFIKACGVGLFAALDQFSVPATVKKTGKLKIINHNSNYYNKNWRLESLDPGANYSGAVVVGTKNYQIFLYDK